MSPRPGVPPTRGGSPLGPLLERVAAECERIYGDRLVSVAVFGSVARGEEMPGSDLDLLVVVRGLADGRGSRMREFEAVDRALVLDLQGLPHEGEPPFLSPVILTPDEVRLGSPLYLDMTMEVILVRDRGGFLARYLETLRGRLARMGARCVGKGREAYWILTPTHAPAQDVAL